MTRIFISTTGMQKDQTIVKTILLFVIPYICAALKNDCATNVSIAGEPLNDDNSGFYTEDSLARRNSADDSSKVITRQSRGAYYDSRERRRLHSLPRSLVSDSSFQPLRSDYGSAMTSLPYYSGQLNTFRNAPSKTGASMTGMIGMDAYDSYWGGGEANTPEAWQGSAASYGSIQPSASVYPSQSLPSVSGGGGYGMQTGAGSSSPYAGYLEKQIASYPIMIYTLNECIPCQRAKQLLALHYPDVRAHFLELSGNEPWQQQLQVDLQYLTGAITFPYIFVCGRYIGGQSDIFDLHESGQLRRMVSQCLKTAVPKL